MVPRPPLLPGLGLHPGGVRSVLSGSEALVPAVTRPPPLASASLFLRVCSSPHPSRWLLPSPPFWVIERLPARYLTLGTGPCPPSPAVGGSSSSRRKRKRPRRLRGSRPGAGGAMLSLRPSAGSGETAAGTLAESPHHICRGTNPRAPGSRSAGEGGAGGQFPLQKVLESHFQRWHRAQPWPATLPPLWESSCYPLVSYLQPLPTFSPHSGRSLPPAPCLPSSQGPGSKHRP